MSAAAEPGNVLLADLNPVAGREQGGRRPVLAVASRRYAAIPGLVLVVPLTTTDRRLPHHIPIPPNRETGLDRISFAMTEQVRALSLTRIDRLLGKADEKAMTQVSRYLHLFID